METQAEADESFFSWAFLVWPNAPTVQSDQTNVPCLSRAGVVSAIGIPHEEPVIPMKRVVLDEVEIIGDRANPNTAEEALSLLSNGRIDLSPLMTHHFVLGEFPKALETFGRRKDGAIKPND